jgi:hypothetical protein
VNGTAVVRHELGKRMRPTTLHRGILRSPRQGKWEPAYSRLYGAEIIRAEFARISIAQIEPMNGIER